MLKTLKHFVIFDLIVIFLIAVNLRVFNSIFSGEWQFGGDSGHYLELSKNLRFLGRFAFTGGDSTLLPTAFRPPLYPFFLSFFWDNPENFNLVPVLVVQFLLSGFSVVLTYRLALYFFNHRILAVVSAILLGLVPLNVSFAGLIATETLFGFLVLLGTSLLVRVRPEDSGSLKRTVPAAVVFGLAFLTRPIILPLLVAFLVAAFFTRQKKIIISYVFLTFVTMLIAAPWIIRNTLLFKTPLLTQSSGYGTNLLAASIEIIPTEASNGLDEWTAVFENPCRFIPDSATELCRESSWDEKNEVEKDRFRMQVALAIIKNDPIHWLKHRAYSYPKLFLLDSGTTFIKKEENVSFSNALKNLNLKILITKSLIGGLSFLVFFFFIWGLKGLFKVEYLCLTVIPVVFALIHLPMWIEQRYFLPAAPFYFIIAVKGGFDLFQSLRFIFINKKTGTKNMDELPLV